MRNGIKRDLGVGGGPGGVDQLEANFEKCAGLGAAEQYAGGVRSLPVDDLEHVLTRTAALWETLRDQHIFITGGTGFFGTWLLETFAYCERKLGLNAQATVLTRNPNAFLSRASHIAQLDSITLHEGDVCTFSFPKRHVDCIVHAASPTAAEASQPRNLCRTIIHGTERVIALAEGHGAKRFLFTSSGAVYGRQPENLSHIREDYLAGPDWMDPKAAYAESKRVAELMCAVSAAESDIRFAIARCFAFVGPLLPLDQHFAIGNFIADALAGRDIRIRGDGTPMRSYLYAADLAIWLWTMLLHGEPSRSSPTVLNVGSGEAISIRDLARTVVEELNPSLEINIAQRPKPGQPREQYVPDVQRAAARFGLRQTIALREAIRRTAAWYREN